MSRIILGKTATQEIFDAMRDQRGTPAKQTAVRLAEKHGVSWQHIYKITEHLRPKNKPRADKGKRKYELKEGTDIWVAASLVVGGKLDPDQAILTCQQNNITNLPSVEYFQRILRENGLGRKQRKSGRRPCRRWESEFPGQMYQIDVTALKVRWEDIKTRRILRIEGVDKNHPNLDETKIRVWQIMATDDHSRRRFLRYVATTRITSRDMVEFCCELFDYWGVPHKIYSDNGAEFNGYFLRAEKILNLLLNELGGFEHQRHTPGNSQASGKIEVAHQWAEKMDRFIGLAIAKGLNVTIDDLNPFADNICEIYDNRVHRATKQTPMVRWHSKSILVRKLPREIIESALLADEFTSRLDETMTVAHKGAIYSLPGVKPFVDYIGQNVAVVVPLNIDLILVKLPCDKEYRELPKILHTADVAGDFKSHAENTAQNLTKRLKAQYKADNQADKQKLKTTGEVFRVPHFNTRIEPETNVLNFPHQEITITPEEIAEVAPVAPSVYSGKLITYHEAIGMYFEQFETPAMCRDFLETVFADDERLPSKQVAEIIENRVQQQIPQFRAVR